MITLTPKILIKAMPRIKNPEARVLELNKYLPKNGIDSKEEIAALAKEIKEVKDKKS